VRDQQVEHVQNRLQECGRQLLRLVQHDDAAGDAVQLAAARGARGKQRFEKLHVGRDDERCIPVLAGQAAAGASSSGADSAWLWCSTSTSSPSAASARNTSAVCSMMLV
jgi:hypothetical protein